jgi:hypothetical protein
MSRDLRPYTCRLLLFLLCRVSQPMTFIRSRCHVSQRYWGNALATWRAVGTALGNAGFRETNRVGIAVRDNREDSRSAGAGDVTEDENLERPSPTLCRFSRRMFSSSAAPALHLCSQLETRRSGRRARADRRPPAHHGFGAVDGPHRRLSMPGPRTGRPAATSPRWQGDSGRSTGPLRPLGCIQIVDLLAEDVAVTGVPGELLDKGEQCPSHADASLAGIVFGVVEVEAGRDLT